MSRRNWGARLHEITVAGLRAVVLENERLRVTVLADKGTDVVEFNDKRRDLDFVWLSPTGVRNPTAVASGAGGDDVAAFLDTYPGGWQEILPNGGAPSRYRGVALAQHGEVATLPWEYEVVADTPHEVAVTFAVECRRMPLRVCKTLRLRSRSATLEVDEELHNRAPVPVEAMWGQHLTFGAPFLRPGATIRLPDQIEVIPHAEAIHPAGRRVAPGGPHGWPVVPGADGGTVDLSIVPEPGEPSDIVYLAGFGDIGWYEVVEGGRGLRVEWDATVLPYLWLWQELGATIDWPWWGGAYVIGVEPFSSYPTNGLAEAAANGTALRLAAGERRAFRMTARVLEGT